jgi:hypothetical protein
MCVCVWNDEKEIVTCIFSFLLFDNMWLGSFFRRINCLSLCLRSSVLNVYSSLNFVRWFVFWTDCCYITIYLYLLLCPARARIAFVCPELFCRYVIGFSNNITLMITSGLFQIFKTQIYELLCGLCGISFLVMQESCFSVFIFKWELQAFPLEIPCTSELFAILFIIIIPIAIHFTR